MLQLADSHAHLFRRGFAGLYGRSPAGAGSEVDSYEALRQVHNIAATLVVGYEDDGIDGSNNEYLRGLAGTRSWMTTVAYVQPLEPPSPARVEELLASGHRGLSLYLLSSSAADIVAQWPREVWRPLVDRQAIISMNVSRDALTAVSSFVRDHAACSFAISHLGDPGRHREVPSAAEAREQLARLLVLAEHANVYVKISGLYAVSDPSYGYPHPQATPFVDLILSAFGPGRCMWGSDFSPSLDHVSFEQAVNVAQLLRLTESEYAEVMGGTLMNLLATSPGSTSTA